VINTESNTFKYYNGTKNVTVVGADGRIPSAMSSDVATASLSATKSDTVQIANVDGTTSYASIVVCNSAPTTPVDNTFYFVVEG